MNRLLMAAIVLLMAISCKKEVAKKMDMSKSKTDISVIRFEEKFYTADEKSLPQLKNEFPYLFPEQNDSIWLNKMKDKEELVLYHKSQTVFGNFESEKAQIKELFQRLKQEHPNFEAPKIITLITNLDYQNKVIYADSLLFVSLDMYLGKNSEVYQDFPAYLSQNFDKSRLMVDIAEAISERYYREDNDRQFLYLLVEAGKKMAMIDYYLPAVSDEKKIGYSNAEFEWAKVNEAQIWKYFIENKLLYSTDSKLFDRFLAEAPFSKFYIDIDKESPGRIGVWLGWQIVKSYIKNNEVTLQQLLQTNAEEIFSKSKYKPKK